MARRLARRRRREAAAKDAGFKGNTGAKTGKEAAEGEAKSKTGVAMDVGELTPAEREAAGVREPDSDDDDELYALD